MIQMKDRSIRPKLLPNKVTSTFHQHFTIRRTKKTIGDGLSVEFIAAVEYGRSALRILFPNKDENYEGETITNQFETTGFRVV